MKCFFGFIFLCIPAACLCEPRNSTSADSSEMEIEENGTTMEKNVVQDTLEITEILEKIFGCCNVESLNNLTEVCTKFDTTIKTIIYPKRAEEVCGYKIPRDSSLTWNDYYTIICITGKNLWDIYTNDTDWIIVSVRPDKVVLDTTVEKHAFRKFRVGSTRGFSFTTTMDLGQLSLQPFYLDKVQTIFEVREWLYLSPYDNSGERKIELLGEDDELLNITEYINFNRTESFISKWQEKVLYLKNYGTGLRKIRFKRPSSGSLYGEDIFLRSPTKNELNH